MHQLWRPKGPLPLLKQETFLDSLHLVQVLVVGLLTRGLLPEDRSLDS